MSAQKFTVHISSRPGMYAQYSGPVHVYAADYDDAIDAAFRKLKQGAFPERTRDMWRVDSVERQS